VAVIEGDTLAMRIESEGSQRTSDVVLLRNQPEEELCPMALASTGYRPNSSAGRGVYRYAFRIRVSAPLEDFDL
jgi:hypothetical protein